MFRPTFSIGHDLRRPADKTGTWVVTGACDPPAYDTLRDARLFTDRETQKFENGRLIPFKPTHAILWQPAQAPAIRRRIPVRMIDIGRPAGVLAALYKENDWRACVIPEWEYNTATGRLFLQDILMGFSWALRLYEESLDMETIW